MVFDLALLARLPELITRLEQQLNQMQGPTPTQDQILRTHEAAALLSIGEAELLALARSGQIPCWRLGNGWRYSRRQLMEAFYARARTNLRADDQAAD
ncbi:helix-turn-helix domain-containing protein [Deinococcus aestuarii]|uniref:helix-turn-helix domain-containing protein n=1 Tax=Deinococcus aestuarii TaxID=2774531 RepID=UPI001C0A976C|nr:helix-turn-helix domain-containing protein [Deinococcus aestuarii]